MGKDNDEMAVLNTKLEVRGIKNLRVFDVSMMPYCSRKYQCTCNGYC